jgi:hypothetical protein
VDEGEVKESKDPADLGQADRLSTIAQLSRSYVLHSLLVSPWGGKTIYLRLDITPCDRDGSHSWLDDGLMKQVKV